MRLGNRSYLLLSFFLIFFNFLYAEEKITTSPLINVDDIKPSFEELDNNEDNSSTLNLKEKKSEKVLNSSQVILIGVDKITANST